MSPGAAEQAAAAAGSFYGPIAPPPQGMQPRGNGAPLRLRVERQCGYKNLKFLKSIRVVDSMAGIGRGTGGINSDFGFHWFAGV